MQWKFFLGGDILDTWENWLGLKDQKYLEKFQFRFGEFEYIYCVPDWVHTLCTRSGAHIVYPIGYHLWIY